jgi:hypothetical protein
MTSIIESADTYDIRVSDLLVAACRQDSGRLHIELRSPHEAWTVTVEGAFSVKSETDGEYAAPVVTISEIVGESVRLIRVRKVDGELEIQLDRWTLTVPPDDDYEAWQMHSSNGERLIAVPGNGVAVWGAGTT